MRGRYLIIVFGILIIMGITAFAVYEYENKNENQLQGVYVMSFEGGFFHGFSFKLCEGVCYWRT